MKELKVNMCECLSTVFIGEKEKWVDRESDEYSHNDLSTDLIDLKENKQN